MKISFDSAKDAVNRQKHGCSLAMAESFDFSDAVIWQDMRFDYGEDRFSAIGYIENRLYAVVFVNRLYTRRIISLRKANKREVLKYAKT